MKFKDLFSLILLSLLYCGCHYSHKVYNKQIKQLERKFSDSIKTVYIAVIEEQRFYYPNETEKLHIVQFHEIHPIRGLRLSVPTRFAMSYIKDDSLTMSFIRINKDSVFCRNAGGYFFLPKYSGLYMNCYNRINAAGISKGSKIYFANKKDSIEIIHEGEVNKFYLKRKYKTKRKSKKELSSLHEYDSTGRLIYRHTSFLDIGIYSETDILYIKIDQYKFDALIKNAINENYLYKQLAKEYVKYCFPE